MKFDKLYTTLREAYTKTLNEDFGNTNYDVDEPSCFERLEELMSSKPELEGVLKPILLEFEDAMMEIDKIDTNNFDPQEVFTSLNRLYPFN
jgi:hypothetical protein